MAADIKVEKLLSHFNGVAVVWGGYRVMGEINGKDINETMDEKEFVALLKANKIKNYTIVRER